LRLGYRYTEGNVRVNEASSSTSSVVGERVGRYLLLHKLAVGGMAEIFLAKSSGIEGFQKVVVLKRILPHLRADETFIQMFLDEARVAANLEHPNIVNVYDIGKAGEDYFFTMAYLHGENLGAVLRRSAHAQRRIPLELALHIVQGVCAGLHYAHEQVGLDGQPLEIVHRDVSSTNVLVTYDGGIKLLDFGIAKAATQSQRTQVGVRKGKASYMSPEQCGPGPLDRRSDVFAIGILLWELTTMRRLYRADNELAIMNMIVNNDAPLPSSVTPDYPRGLEAIVMKALARDREQRYRTARALQEDLDVFVREQGLGTTARALAEMLDGLFGAKPLPWASDGVLTEAGNTHPPSPEPTMPAYSEGVGDAAGATLPAGVGSVASAAPGPETPRSRAPLFAVLGTVGAVATVAAAWGILGGGGGDESESPPKTAAAVVSVEDAAEPSPTTPASIPATLAERPCPENMVEVAGGKVYVGTDARAPALALATPSHRVEIGRFCLDLHEVTTADYHRCSEHGECKRAFRTSHWAEEEPAAQVEAFSGLCNEDREGAETHPINCVTWAQADRFCRWRGARLPTEHEWERAARGDDGRVHPWGDEVPGPERLNACGSECVAWFRRSGLELDAGMFPASDGHVETSPVGGVSGGPGSGGVVGLAGNVAEWSADAFAFYPGAVQEAEIAAGAKVVRGSSFHGVLAAEADPAFRRAIPGDYHPHDVGFRCAADPES